VACSRVNFTFTLISRHLPVGTGETSITDGDLNRAYQRLWWPLRPSGVTSGSSDVVTDKNNLISISRNKNGRIVQFY
jgi:hypothetical protein